MEGGKTNSIPLASYMKMCLNDCPKSDAEKVEMAKVSYLSNIVSLMYAMIYTRPHIACALGVGRWYMSYHGKKHWEVVKGIMHYLKVTRSDRSQVWMRGCMTKRGLRALVSPPNHTKNDSSHKPSLVLTQIRPVHTQTAARQVRSPFLSP